jgi:ribose/xylose/arabinose/galactoside ABC-type transport system permease subunit
MTRLPSIRSRQRIIDNALLAGLVVLCAFFTSQTAAFLTSGNARNIALNSAILGIVVVPSTLLVLAGYLDLAIGSTVGLGATLTALAIASWHWSAFVAIGVGITAGIGVGAINGCLCSLLLLSPIIVTLGMLGAVRGVTLLITSESVFGLGPVMRGLGANTIAGVPILVVIALGVFVLGWVFLGFTPWGRFTYAIGVNREAAFISGLPVRTLPFWLYVVTGAAAGLAGVLSAAQLDGASPADMGLGMELDALTAILLGGVAFAGGRGRLSGVFVAVVFLGVLADGLTLMNVEPFVQQLAKGLALIFAAGLDALALRAKHKGRADRGLVVAEASPSPSPSPASVASRDTPGQTDNRPGVLTTTVERGSPQRPAGNERAHNRESKKERMGDD